MSNRRSQEGRVTRLEAALGTTGQLTAAEAAELERLEREYAARFPDPIDAWSMDQLDDYLFTFSTGADGLAPRLDELRKRNGFFDRMAEN